jgi:arylformamidase
MKCLFLSHIFTSEIPVYGGRVTIAAEHVKSTEHGDSSNVFKFSLENHWGTHVDCPAHFFTGGMDVNDYEPDFWIFLHPQVILINAKQMQIIGEQDFPDAIDQKTDLLLLKSGWGKFRTEDSYCTQNPGLDPDAARYLRREFPSIRAVGFDWVSLSSYGNRELGREAHRNLLNPTGEGHPIVAIEDMALDKNLVGLTSVLVVPLRIDGIDSAPCTVIGMFNNEKL